MQAMAFKPMLWRRFKFNFRIESLNEDFPQEAVRFVAQKTSSRVSGRRPDTLLPEPGFFIRWLQDERFKVLG
jgi:hypothetical protein